MKRHVFLFAIALILGVTIWVVPSQFVRYWLAFALLWLLPGLSWAFLIPRTALDRPEWLAVGLGLSFVVTPVTALLVAYLPGPLTRSSLLLAIVGAIGLPVVLSTLARLGDKPLIAAAAGQVDAGRELPTGTPHRAPFAKAPPSRGRDGWVLLLIAVLIAAGLRFVNLDYSEFQGDEAKVIVRAAQALEGDDAILFQHKKGPTQLTMVMPGWRLTGVTNEWMARLPFAWASVLGVVAVFLFGRRLNRPYAGGIAACLLAIEGYLLGFGRIVQYQSLVFVLSALGLLCVLAFYSLGRGSLLVVGAAFFAGGALAHYDAILALPAGLLLVGARLWQDRQQTWRVTVPVVIAVAIGVLLVGLFYLPFLRSSYVDTASSYVSGRIGGQVYNNLRSTFELSAVYNAVYLLGFMLLALIVQTLSTWSRWGRLGLVLSGVLIVASLSGLARPQAWAVGDLTLAWIPVLALLVGALLAPDQPLGIRATWLWLGGPVMFYLFFVASPLTHVYTVFPAWALLAGLGLADLGRWLAGMSRPAFRVAGIAGVVVYLVCAFYAVMMFVDHTPEYRRTFPKFKRSLYWTPYEQMPKEGLFGFPYRAGWKVVGHLMDDGQLVGSYDSNEKSKVTDYYTRQATRFDCASPDLFVIAVNVQDEEGVPWQQIQDEYQPAVIVTVNGEPKLTVHQRDVTGPPQTHRVEDFVERFDLGSTPDRYVESSLDERELMELEGVTSREADFGNLAHLLGYRVDTQHAIPGGHVELTLLWQAVSAVQVDYTVFTHLYDGEMMRGQLDGQPVCGNRPTSTWQPNQIILDPYRIPIKSDAPPGMVPLTIGMYDLATMQRLPVFTPDGSPAGDNVYLTDIEIQAP